MENEPMLFFEPSGFMKEMLKSNNYRCFFGGKVKIDRIIRDLSQETVIGVSGIINIRGVKMRGYWDCFGNIMEFRSIFIFTRPKSWIVNMDDIFKGTSKDMFRLVHVEEIENHD